MTPIASSETRAEREDMEKYGIRKVTEDHFHVGGFHYTRLSDALAQSQRSDPRVADAMGAPGSAEDPDALARHGIERRHLDRYLYGAFRYTKLQDALAQAKHAARWNADPPAGLP